MRAERPTRPRAAQRIARALWVRLPRPVRRSLVRLLEPTFLVSVVLVAIDEHGRLLCVRHVFRPQAYPWGLPSGFVRRGEPPHAAALRELHEETGYEAVIEALLATSLVQPDQIELQFRARLGARHPARSFESVEAGLYRPDALPRGFLPSNLETLRRHGFPEAAEHRG